MDWFSWLSRTNLHPSLIYQYGVTFSQNELQQEDITYFNHEFLLSMGISIAKHRLEILKLAKNIDNSPNSSTVRFSKFITAFKKCVNRFVFNKNFTIKALPEPEPAEWRNRRLPVIRTMRQVKSGPLVGKEPDYMMVNQRRLMKLSGSLDDRKMRLSGPLDGNSHERLVYSYRSPNRRAVIGSGGKSPRTAKPFDCNNNEKSKAINDDDDDDDVDDKLLWAALFQDMKPT